jgi:hypothetical protein
MDVTEKIKLLGQLVAGLAMLNCSETWNFRQRALSSNTKTRRYLCIKDSNLDCWSVAEELNY